MRAVWQQTSASEAAAEPQALAAALFTRAQQIHDDDVERCLHIGAHGAGLLKPGDTILTHCNAGALATAGYGTALGVVRAAFARHEGIDVLVDETRPWLQGARRRPGSCRWRASRIGSSPTVWPAIGDLGDGAVWVTIGANQAVCSSSSSTAACDSWLERRTLKSYPCAAWVKPRTARMSRNGCP